MPYEFSNYEVYENTLPGGMRDTNIEENIRAEFKKLRQETKEILIKNEVLLKKASLILGERGNMTGEDFLNIIKETPGNTLTLCRLEEAKKENSYEFYEEILKK